MGITSILKKVAKKSKKLKTPSTREAVKKQKDKLRPKPATAMQKKLLERKRIAEADYKSYLAELRRKEQIKKQKDKAKK